MPNAFHVQYGLARHVGRFSPVGVRYETGQSVVVRTGRGTELGRVVAEARDGGLVSGEALPPILRAAGPEDLVRAAREASERHRRFEACRKVFDEGTWPIEPIDLEPLLDDGRAVLHYLGPHGLDVAGLLGAIREACGLELVFEPVGRDITEDDLAEPEPHDDHDHGCGSCGSEGGGCGSEGGGCGTSADGKGGGCSGCAVGDLVASRRRATTRA